MTVMSSIVVVSDRILAGERPNASARQCAERMAAEGLAEPAVRVVREAREAVEEAIRQALDAGHRLVLVLGGSGFRAGNDAPEAARAYRTPSPRPSPGQSRGSLRAIAPAPSS